MSSVAVFSPAELPSFSGETFAAKRARAVSALSSSVRTATTLEVRPAPEMVPFGIGSLDALTGGVPRGALTELFGPASSGRTSVMLSLVASVTLRQEVCALIDVTDSFDPVSAEAAGVDLKRLLWVRCGKARSQQSGVTSQQLPGRRTSGVRANTIGSVAPPAKNISWSIHQNYDARLRHAITGGCHDMMRGRIASFEYPVVSSKPAPSAAVQNAKPETRNLPAQTRIVPSKWAKLDQALKATDLLLQSGGFGLIVIDLGDISVEQARRIPLTSWFRFRRVVENTPTILLLVARDTCAKTCASLVLQLGAQPLQSGSSAPRFEFQVSSKQPQELNRAEFSIRNTKLETRNHLSHVNLLDGLDVRVELVRTRLERKPVQSTGSLQTQTLWKRKG